jgi:hypothetical protein
MILKFFIKCGAAVVLISLLMALFCIEGCLERASGPAQEPSPALDDQMTNSGFQMDYDVELSSDLFRVKGDLLFAGSGLLPYILVNATLGQGERVILTTGYLIMQIEPDREYGFEICKSCRLSAGDYDCDIRIEAPQGVMAEDGRKVRLAKSLVGPGEWSEAEEAAFWRMIEENAGEEDLEDAGRANSAEEDEERDDHREEDAGAKDDIDASSGPEEDKVGKDGMQEPSLPEERSREPSLGGLAEDDNAGARSQDDLLVGSITSKKYHLSDCRYAQKIKPENLISFQSIEDAKSQGYLPCKVCNP